MSYKTVEELQEAHNVVDKTLYNLLIATLSREDQDACLLKCSSNETIPEGLKAELTEEQLELVPGIVARFATSGW